MMTKWEYSTKTEAERLLHCARQMAVGFYRANNFIVLPNLSKSTTSNIVTLPNLPYNKIPRFWKKVALIDVETLPIQADKDLVLATEEILKEAKLPIPNFKEVKNTWNNAQNEVISEIYKIMPKYKEMIKKITIYPTTFGTASSFNLISKNGEIILYLRNDKSIATIVEAIITSLTRTDIYQNLSGIWQESEIITDWLVTESSLANVIKKYDKTSFLQTIKSVRVKQQAKLLAESDEFYKELGLAVDQKVFDLNGKIPEINKKPLENLSIKERILLKLLIEKANNVATFDEMGEVLFDNEDNFSLYAISKNIERLRTKLELNGVSGSYIQTLRGQGYMLKN